MVTFDTLKASRRLRDAGFEEEKADALVHAFAEDIGANLATKDDIALLRQEMAVGFESQRKDTAAEMALLRNDMTAELAAQRQEMTAELAAQRKDTANEFAAVRQELAAQRKDMASEFAAVRQEMANGFESLRKDMTADMALLEQRMSLRIALAAGGGVTAILTAIGIVAGIIVSRL